MQRRAGSLSPQLLQEMMKAFRVIAQSYSEQELARLISTGQIERVIETAFSDNVLNAAYAPVRDRIRSGVTDGVRYFVKSDIPVPKGSIGIAFDSLSPHVIEAIRKLETKVITNLKGDVRETVRQHIQRGLTEGLSPKQMSKGLRDVIGLSPNQELAVFNYERALRGEGRNPLDYKLRDKRFDKTLAKGKPLTEEQIQAQVGAYRRRMIAHNAEVNARQAALNANKLAQRLSWADAAEQGIVDRGRLIKTRIGVNDARERPEHVAINNEVRRFDEVYSNGEMYCGELDWGCRCIDRYSQRRA